MSEPISYSTAGVDVEAGERAVALMRAAVQSAQRPETLGDLGGFVGLFDASLLAKYRRPLLATSTDGVGTKLAVARAMDLHSTIGRDLVAMVVDDLVVCGAEPLFLTDYIATGSVHPERIAAIVAGIAEGCLLAGCALLGGETAEHPGLLEPDEYDLAAAGTGVVEADALLGAHRVRAGDIVLAMASSGLHSNGYSLARRVLLESDGVETYSEALGRTLGEELLEPTVIYTKACLDLAAHLDVHAFSHITGGGVAANLARVLPEELAADIDRGTWQPLPVFALIEEQGPVARDEMERTFNQGIGMVAILPEHLVGDAVERLGRSEIKAWPCGQVRQRRDGESGDAPAKGGRGGAVLLRGTYLSSS